MILKAFDDLLFHNRFLSVSLARVLNGMFSSRLWGDFTYLAAVTLACGFYQYERFLPGADAIGAVLTVWTILAWLFVAFENGFVKRSGFAIFALVFWVVPQAVILWFETAPLNGYNVILATAARFSRVVTMAPLWRVAGTSGVGGFVTAAAMLLLCEFVFILGMMTRNSARSSGWYCKYRKLQPDKEFL